MIENSHSLKTLTKEFKIDIWELRRRLENKFEIFINSLTSKQSEAKELKSLCFAVISKSNQAYEFEAMKNQKIEEKFGQIQQEAAQEWNSRQLGLIHRIELLEKQAKQHEFHIQTLCQEKSELQNSTADLQKSIQKSFNEITQKLKNPSINFETQFQIEKNMLDILDLFEKNKKSEFETLQSKNFQCAEYNKVINITEFNIDQSRGLCKTNSLSSLSNFLEETYNSKSFQKNIDFPNDSFPKNPSFHERLPSNDTFRTQFDENISLSDSFTTIKELPNYLETTVSTIFPPIDLPDRQSPLNFNKFRYNLYKSEST